MYLLFPSQTVVCAALLAYFSRDYGLRLPGRPAVAAGAGLLVFALWASPQVAFHRPARLDGFDPNVFGGHPALYWGELALRFVRLVVVVPLLEEIFWRGFLLRFLIREEFETVPFGTYSRKANALVALGFMLEHAVTDWPAALAAGVLYNMVAFRTRSLSSCILAHAFTNALLGAYIMSTGQWGFW